MIWPACSSCSDPGLARVASLIASFSPDSIRLSVPGVGTGTESGACTGSLRPNLDRRRHRRRRRRPFGKWGRGVRRVSIFEHRIFYTVARARGGGGRREFTRGTHDLSREIHRNACHWPNGRKQKFIRMTQPTILPHTAHPCPTIPWQESMFNGRFSGSVKIINVKLPITFFQLLNLRAWT